MNKVKYLVGIGASAGGLEALTELLSHLPPLVGDVAFVIAQHLNPNYKSMLVALLGRASKLTIEEAQSYQEIEANHVYIAPPDSEILVTEGKIILQKPSSAIRPKPSVDVLFTSIAEEYGEFAIGVILSGTGTDGAEGIREIKKKGGITIAQNPQTAKYDGMPMEAIHVDEAEFVLDTIAIGEKIIALVADEQRFKLLQAKAVEASPTHLDRIFVLLSHRTGTNFANYKPATICRRLDRRLTDLGIANLEVYLKYIQENPKETDQLFNTILIGTTAFFRDKEAFSVLETYLEKIITNKKTGEPIRIWIAGCATGEEAYSVAILVYQYLERQTENHAIQIFATDIDQDALSFGRKGVYPITALDNVPTDLLEKYFLKKGEKHYEVVKTIRNLVLFSKHDITATPPFIRLDLISCRNLLIYFGANLQKQIFPIFHYSLLPRGYLFLGKSESIGNFTDLFEAVDSKNKFFQRKIGISSQDFRYSVFKSSPKNIAVKEAAPTYKDYALADVIRDTIFQTFDHAYILVSSNLDILEIRGEMRDFLSFGQGKSNLNLLKLAHRDLQLELRTLFGKAVKERKEVRNSLKRYDLFQKNIFLRLHIKPLLPSPMEDLYLVIFERIELGEDLKKLLPTNGIDAESVRNSELEQELVSLKEHLQVYVEEIETSNEELQSLNEEMQSSNEELQSSNEKLETSNEELQSSNGKLKTSNEELQIAYSKLKTGNENLEIKDKQLDESLTNFKALFDNTLQGFVMIGRNYSILLFNQTAADILDQISSQKIALNESFLNFLPASHLQDFISEFKTVLEGKPLQVEKAILLDNTTQIWLDFSYVPVQKGVEEINAVVLGILDITQGKKAELELLNQKELFKSLVESNTSYLIRTGMQGNYTYVNEAFCQKFGFSHAQLIGKSYIPTVHQEDLGVCEEAMKKLFANPASTVLAEIRKPNPKGGYFDTEWEFAAIQNSEGTIIEVQGLGRDITVQKATEKALQEERDQLEMMIWGGRLGTWNWDIQTGGVKVNKLWGEILGYAENELDLDIESWKKLIHPDDFEKVWEALQANIKGETVFYEVEHRKKTKNGEWKWLLATGKVVERDKEGRALRVIGIRQDITDKKRSEEAVSLSEGRAYAIFETMQEGIVVHDMTGAIISCNQSAERILGLSYDQMIGKTSIDASWRAVREDESPFAGEDHPAIFTLRTGKAQSNVIMGVHKPNSEIVWISINSQILRHPDSKEPYAVFATFNDITERKNARTQISISNRRMRDILEGTNVGTWEWNVQTGESHFSERWAEIMGYTLAELEPIDINTWAKHIHPEDIAISSQLLQDHLAGLTDSYQCEIRTKHKKGHWVWFWSMGRVFSWTEDGRPLWMSGIHQDITERKNAELRLVKQNDELRATEEELKANMDDLLKAKQFLEDSESKIRAISDSTMDNIMLISPNYEVLFFNKPAYEAIKLLENKEIAKGNHILDYIDEHKISFTQNFHKALTGERITVERELVFGEQKMWFEVSYFPVYNTHNQIIGVSFNASNITVRKNLQSETERLATLIRYTKNPVMITDPEGKITWVNEAFCELSEYTLEEVLGKDPAGLFQGVETDPRTVDYIARQLAEGRGFATEIVNYSKSGRKYWVYIDCQVIRNEKEEIQYYVTIETDITNRKRLEGKLYSFYREAKNFRNALEKSAIISVYDLNRNFVEVNTAFCQISGYASYELIGKHYTMLSIDSQNNEPNVFEKMWENAEKGECMRNEICRVHKSGELYWVDCVLNPIIDIKGKISRFMAVSYDITARKKVEELNALQAQKLQTKLEAEVAEKTEALQAEKIKIETINKQIRGSIFYAKRIQTAILPQESYMREHLSDFFIYNLPKDIVSGDFYWFGVQKNKIILSVIDCTGHGVPGAFMSMIGYSLLNEIVHKEKVTNPVLILETLNEEVKLSLKQKDSQVQDGMDMALVCIDKTEKSISFAGAKNHLIYALNGEAHTVRGSKRHVGGKYVTKANFEQQDLPYDTDAVYYMYSDGYVDQFGGEHKRKFSQQNLEQLILQIHQKPMTEQMDILDQNFIAWMGGFGLRLDDVLILAFKI